MGSSGNRFKLTETKRIFRKFAQKMFLGKVYEKRGVSENRLRCKCFGTKLWQVINLTFYRQQVFVKYAKLAKYFKRD